MGMKVAKASRAISESADAVRRRYPIGGVCPTLLPNAKQFVRLPCHDTTSYPAPTPFHDAGQDLLSLDSLSAGLAAHSPLVRST